MFPAIGGTPNYTYLWDDASASTTAMISGLPAGTYNVTVTDTKGCTDITRIGVTEPAVVSMNFVALLPQGLNVSCNGLCDAQVQVTAAGGTAPYPTYAWSQVGVGNSSTAALCSGKTYVTITDANGCTGKDSVMIGAPLQISTVVTGVNVLCKGESTGSASVVASNGFTPYNYQWSDALSQSGANATGLIAGKYYVTVSDVNSCSVVDSITITEPALGLSLTATSVAASCFSSADGSLSLVVSGGTLTSWIDYQYAWSTGATTASVNGLVAGTYTVTVTDQNGCTIDTSLVVTAPTELIASTVLINNVSCNSGSDGSVSVSAIGGTPNYTYLWDDASASTTAMISGLPAGTYNVTVTDTKGCTDITSIGVTEPAVVSMSFTALLPQGLNVSCNGLCDAQVQVTASGGTAPYPTYAWSQVGVGNSSTAALCSGKTYVTITDSKGCTGNDSVTIGAPLQISTVVTGVNVLCKGESTGSASVVASNGFTPYNYQWSDALSQSGANATGLIAGKYYVTVSDVNSCSVTDSITITRTCIRFKLNSYECCSFVFQFCRWFTFTSGIGRNIDIVDRLSICLEYRSNNSKCKWSHSRNIYSNSNRPKWLYHRYFIGSNSTNRANCKYSFNK
ncbi:MAG: SprB repeat-containing protein [Bacteroidales bacterium]|nr:SprB repeat-containing protein [Bacteroidales bacterium]